MKWSEEEVRNIVERLDPMALLWLLIMHRGEGSTGVQVGPNAASNAVKLYGKVRSYAKNRGVNPPPNEKRIKQGYKHLLRVHISHPNLGTNSIVKGDKIDYLKLTSVGKRLVTRIHTEPSLKEFVKLEAGLDVDVEPEPKWPDEYDNDNVTIVMTPTEAISNLEPPFQLPTRAEFACPICSESLVNEYTFEYPTDAWSKYATTTCGECSTRLRHKVGNLYAKVEPVER